MSVGVSATKGVAYPLALVEALRREKTSLLQWAKARGYSWSTVRDVAAGKTTGGVGLSFVIKQDLVRDFGNFFEDGEICRVRLDFCRPLHTGYYLFRKNINDGPMLVEIRHEPDFGFFVEMDGSRTHLDNFGKQGRWSRPLKFELSKV